MLVCTADRPPELRDTGAGQTIDQNKLYGDAVRWFFDPGPPEAIDDAGPTWRAIACRAFAAAQGPPAGPVHLNLPFREPLVPTGAALVDAPGRESGAPWISSTTTPRAADTATVQRLAALVRAHPRGLLVAGWGADTAVATATRFARAPRAGRCSRTRSPVSAPGPHAVSTYEALLRIESFAASYRPDLVVRIGAPVTSKVLNGWLDSSVEQVRRRSR